MAHSTKTDTFQKLNRNNSRPDPNKNRYKTQKSQTLVLFLSNDWLWVVDRCAINVQIEENNNTIPVVAHGKDALDKTRHEVKTNPQHPILTV